MNTPTDTAGPPGVAVPTGGLLAEFEAVYRAEVGPVTAFFARRSRDPHTVADLASDTFVEAMTSFATFDPTRGGVRGWLFGIARRVFARHCDRVVRHIDAVRRDAGRRPSDPDAIDELVRRIDAERDGRALLDRLARQPAIDREAVELVDLAGLTPKEAATALGISSGALRVRLHRARTRLRKGDEHEKGDNHDG